MSDQKYLQLKEEIDMYIPMMQEAADTVIDQDISKYPIFVFHKQEIAVGIHLVNQKKVQGNWSVNLSTMEEFVSKQLIAEENINAFREKYKDPETHFCLFILSELGADFIFIPRKK